VVELRVFSEAKSVLYDYYCILHLLQCFQEDLKKKTETEANKHSLRLGWVSGNLSSAMFLAFV